MKTKATTIDEYLAPLSSDKRAALQKVRKTILAAAPGATECISYGLPAFCHQGRVLMHIGAGANHCAVYPGAHPVVALAAELKAYTTSKGTIRFAPDRPLPATLVRKLVKTRIAEIAAKRSKLATKATKKSAPRARPARRKAT